MRLLESLPDDVSLAEIHAHVEAARDQFDRRASSDGISRFHGDPSEFDGKVITPGGLQIAQYEGLKMFWEYEPSADFLTLHLVRGNQTSDPILQIPLSEDEIQILSDCQEEGGWGYYELRVEDNDDRAAVNISLITAKKGPVSLLWIVDKSRRAALRRAFNRFAADSLMEE